MPALPDNFTISAEGSYDYSGLKPGSKYALEFVQDSGGVFPATVDVQFPTGPDGAYVTAVNGEFTSATRAARFIAPSKNIRFVVGGDPGAFAVSLTEYR